MEKILLYLLYKFNYSWDDVYSAIQNNKRVPMSEVNKYADTLKINYITIIEKDYPTYLTHVFKPPFAIFYHGDLNMLEEKIIGVIGKPTTSNIKHLKLLKSIGYVLCFKKWTLDEQSIKLLVDNNIPSIICCDDIDKIEKDEKLKELLNYKNILCVSESYKHDNNLGHLDYYINRIFIGNDNPMIIIDESINKDTGLIAYLSATKHKTYSVDNHWVQPSFQRYINSNFIENSKDLKIVFIDKN